jgi:hypothetical protein
VNAATERSVPESSPADRRPIELVTENGFSIVRVWEISRVPPPDAGNYHFIVRNPQSLEREIAVELTGDVVVQIELQTMGRILLSSTFWICCSEGHLATYLWEHNNYPPGDQLRINQLAPEDLMTALRWQTT